MIIKMLTILLSLALDLLAIIGVTMSQNSTMTSSGRSQPWFQAVDRFFTGYRVLFMITTGSPQPWFQAADRIFTGYRPASCQRKMKTDNG